MNKAELAQKIREKFGMTAEPWPDQEEVNLDAPTVKANRADKRRSKQRGSLAGSSSVHDVLRLGPRPGRAKRATGQPNWFQQMKWEAQRRKALEKVSLDRLEPAVGRIALDLYHAGYESVWGVTQVKDINTLLRVGRHDTPEMGVSSSELKRLRTYLVQQRVPVKWDA